MRIASLILALSGALALTAAGAGIDGKWTFESKVKDAKAGGDRTMTSTLDLKSDGGAVTGAITMSGGRRDRTATIRNGKIEGEKFSFETVQQTKRGEVKMRLEGAVTGDELKGTFTREGRRRGVPFTAKRK